jgi:Spy/CpxP family protein refolding chaperone
MSRKSSYLLIAAVVAGALVTAPAIARPGCDRHGHGGPGFESGEVMHLTRKLELEDAQRDRLFEISDRHRPALRKLHLSMRDARRSLHGILAGGYDEAKVAAEAAALGESMRALHLAKAKMLAEMNEVLTPAQREKLAELDAVRPRRDR